MVPTAPLSAKAPFSVFPVPIPWPWPLPKPFPLPVQRLGLQPKETFHGSHLRLHHR